MPTSAGVNFVVAARNVSVGVSFLVAAPTVGTPNNWPTYLVEISFLGGTAGTFQLDVSKLDVGVLSTPYSSTAFQAIPGVRSVTIVRGRQDELSQIQAGTCDVVFDNHSGDLSPGNPTSAYSPNVLPMRRLRVSGVWQGKAYPLFYGFIESYTPTINSETDTDMVVHAIDAFFLYNRQPLNATIPAGDDGTWVQTVLSNLNTAGLPLAIDPGAVHFIAYTSQPNENALQVLQDAATSAGGQFLILSDGTNLWHSRYHRTLAARSNTVQATFGQPQANGRYAAGVYPIMPGFGYAMDTQHLYTRVVVQSGDATEAAQQADDPAAQDYLFVSLLGPIAARFLGAGQALDMAQALLNAYRLPVPRLTALTIDGDADTDGSLWRHVLGREIADRVHVQLNLPGQIGLDADMFIESIRHEIVCDPAAGPEGHRVTYQVSLAATVGNPFILDTSTLDSGQLG